MLYATKREDLLGGLVDVLTGGRVKKVTVSDHAHTGMTEYDTRTGKVRRIVMPREENLPAGCTVAAARGLLDHESGHANFTEIDTVNPGTGLLHTIENILEDPRIEILMMDRFAGCQENIAALIELGNQLMVKGITEGKDTLALALMGLSYVAYHHDPRPLFLGKPNGAEILAFLEHAQPHVDEALASTDTAGVTRASRAILALLKDASKHQPKQEPKPDRKPAPQEQGEGGEAEEGGEQSTGAGSGSEAGEDAPEDEEKGDGTRDGSEVEEGQDEGPGSKEGKESDPKGPEGEDEPSCKPRAGETAEGQEPEDGESDGSERGGGEPETGEAPASSALADAAEEAETAGRSLAPMTPAEMVLDKLKDAIAKEIKELAKAETAELLKAQRSGLICPIGTRPIEWRDYEWEEKIQVDQKMQKDYRDNVEALKPIIMGIRHALRSQLLAEGRTRIRTAREEGELDPRALFHVAQGTSSAVFRSITKGKSTSTHISLLVDCSGSMRGSKEIQARRAAVALNEALQGLPGVSTEILGFTWSGFPNGGYGCLHRIAKSARERAAAGTMDLTAGGGNCDGSAVRWATRRALGVKADRRILIVLSDGCPTDGPRPEQDLRAAIDACERHQVETIGIGIQDDSVTRFYPKSFVIYDVRELTGAVLQVLANLLKPKSVAMARGMASKAV